MFAQILIFFMCLPVFAEGFELDLEVAVTRTDPVYETLVRKVPYEYCWDEKVPIRQKRKRYNHNVGDGLIGGFFGRQIGKGKGKDAAIIAGTLIGSGARDEKEILGGVIGGALGRNVGKGKGRDAAIAAGTLIGASLSRRKTEDSGTYRIEKRCTTKYKDTQYRELVGYNNHGKIMGREISKFSARELKTFLARISVSY